MLVTFCPLTEMLVVFQELMKPPRLLACQQKVPAPSKVNGTVMVEVTGLHAPPVGGVVAVLVTTGATVGVKVRVGVGGGAEPVRVTTTTGVLVRVGLGPLVEVRVRVALGPLVGVKVRVAVGPVVEVKVRLGVLVITGVAGVFVRVGVGCVPPAMSP